MTSITIGLLIVAAIIYVVAKNAGNNEKQEKIAH